MAQSEIAAAQPDARSLDPLTTGGALAEAARRWPENDALIIGERRLTHAGLLAEATAYARGLLALGVKGGEHVGILMPNAVEYVLLFHACGLLGARALTINARYREDDLLYVVDHADMELLFIGGQALPHVDFRAMLARLHPELAAWRDGAPLAVAKAPRLRAVFNLADPRESAWPTEAQFLALAGGVPAEAVAERARAVRPGDGCLTMFSSGTTARPKACMLTHANLTRTGAALAERFAMTAGDRVFDPLPFFHMSTMLPMAACRASGAAFIGSLHFEPGRALAEIEREHATILYVSFPTLFSGLIGHADFGTRDLSSVRIAHAVGPADLLRRYSAAFPRAFFSNAYGLTEASGVVAYNDPADPLEFSFTTAGRPFPGVEIRIADPETGTDLPQGEPGEILIRGHCLFQGYYKDPERTAAVTTPDGWLRSGDIGSLDPDGRVVYRGRLKDMLKIGGENVAAVEIESFLSTHPAVDIAQVIAVPDEHLFEVAAAFVQLKPGAEVAAEDLVRHCVGKIASYKIPRYIRFVTDWPLSATKIQKFRLAEGFKPEGKIDMRALMAG